MQKDISVYISDTTFFRGKLQGNRRFKLVFDNSKETKGLKNVFDDSGLYYFKII